MLTMSRLLRVRQRGREPGGQFQRVRRAVERRDGHAGDPLHHQALIEHGHAAAPGSAAATSGSSAGSVGQNRSMITPCGMYMKPSRTGGLYAAAGRPSAVRPAHRLQQRQRERDAEPAQAGPATDQQVTSHWRCLSWFVDATMGERIAGHDADDERLHTIVVLRDRRQSVDRRRSRRSLPTGGTGRRPAACRSGCGRSRPCGRR